MDVGAIPQFAEKMHVNILQLQFYHLYKILCEVLNKKNVNINNELHFPDVY